MVRILVGGLALLVISCGSEQKFTNSIGMEMIPLKPGSFQMGDPGGEYDESPVHEVTISRALFISQDPVTNADYERFDPAHRDQRTGGDIDPVSNVSWQEAVDFCGWLGRKEGRPYRLPTEAEWEYAARETEAPPGTDLPRDMCGAVEQWCLDWYGPYRPGPLVDPGGYREGTHRVTRGGSKWTGEETFRPTNRMSFLPADRFAGLGFRVVIGDPPDAFVEEQPVPLNQQDIASDDYDWDAGRTDPQKPVLREPIVFVKIPRGSNGPLFEKHNHFPSITWCPNGDLLATWYTCLTESGRQLNIAASRLRRGSEEWEEASLFWSAADRNDHSAALWTDPDSGRIYHFQGTGSHPNQGNQVLVLRISDDSGTTWSEPRIINDTRSMWNPHAATKTREGHLVVTSDYNFDQPMWGRIALSRDGGISWEESPGKILGQHCGIVQLRDGKLMAVGRDNWNAGHEALPGFGLPVSTSADWGESWEYRREPALSGGIKWGQRPALIRLREGPILYIGFSEPKDQRGKFGIEITDAAGKRRKIYGLFSALSMDEGKTWRFHKLISPGPERRTYDGGGNTHEFYADATYGEPAGYLQAMQSPDGMIHLVSSRIHYRFNLAWLKAPTVGEAG